VSFDLILPFLRPIADLIQDPTVSEIMVNGSQRVFLERDGVVHSVEGVMLEERSLRVAVRNIARTLGDDVSEETPDPRRAFARRIPRCGRVAAVQPRRHDARHPEISVEVLDL
jgi:Flp pilus assembly CpaF family ATPase